MPRAALLVVVTVCACGGTSPRSAQTATNATGVEACARSFVDHELTRPIHVGVRRLDAHVVAFDAMYGEAHDCEAGCFYSHAVGIALSCERMGWIAIHDYEGARPRDFSRFELQPGDAILFDESLWDADRSFSEQSLVPWLVRHPSTPADARARAGRWLTGGQTRRDPR